MKPYDKVKWIRSYEHPVGGDYVKQLLDDRIELHGDRFYADDESILCGLGYLDDVKVVYVATDKGHTAQERLRKQHGCPKPEGYFKSQRIFKMAEKFHIPVLCIIDTLGAFCGSEGEEHGQGHAIATNLVEMMTLKTPIISVLTGEGGSGGALALGVADKFIMMENSVFSVITPDGCASILWKDSSRVQEASEYLHITAEDMIEYDVCDGIVSEEGSFEEICDRLKKIVVEGYRQLVQIPLDELISRRYQHFRELGIYEEV